MSVFTLSDEEAVEKFRQVNPKSILYFTATWCPPCKAIAPVYEEMSKEYPDVGFGKVDVDDNGEAAQEYMIQAVPTFIFFDGENETNKFSGADTPKLKEIIEELNSR